MAADARMGSRRQIAERQVQMIKPGMGMLGLGGSKGVGVSWSVH